MEKGFTKEDTNAVKGIAIFCMIFHHVYPNISYIPVNKMENVTLLAFVAAVGKVCVALLTLLSGYGLSESYKRQAPLGVKENVKFVVSHYIKLVSLCWFVYIWTFMILYMLGDNILLRYGSGKIAVLKCIIDVFGISGLVKTPQILGGWYYTTIVVYYLLYPLVDFIVKKIKLVSLAFFAMPWIPWMLKYIFEVESMKKDYNSDQWYYYLFSFAFGIYLSKNRVLDKKVSKKKTTLRIIGSWLLLICCILLRAYLTIPVDLFLAYAIIDVYISSVSKCRGMRSFLETFGKESANMWLVHGVIISLACMWPFESSVCRFIVVFFFSYASALALEGIKKGMKYSIMIEKIRTLVTR